MAVTCWRRPPLTSPGSFRSAACHAGNGCLPPANSCTASHLGLAAARYGDRETARDAWQLSRRVAEQDLNHDVSRIARADTNLAGLAAETGHGPDAASVISGVFTTRLALADRQPEDAAAWRRLTVTARIQADIARTDGRVGDGVRLAADLLADRQARLGDPAHADIAEARLALGQALLVAGGHRRGVTGHRRLSLAARPVLRPATRAAR
jgi:hypothetical protein